MLPSIGKFETPFLGNKIVNWEDPRRLSWLMLSMAKKPFQKVVRFYESQCDKFMCGPASIAILLNAIYSMPEKPLDNEANLRAHEVNPDLPPDYIACFRRFTQKNVLTEKNNTKSLAEVYARPSATGTIFDRAAWGIAGGGHISPIAAYDAVSGRVLVIDVNTAGHWVWVDINLFLKSMASFDQGSPRGYLIVSKQ